MKKTAQKDRSTPLNSLMNRGRFSSALFLVFFFWTFLSSCFLSSAWAEKFTIAVNSLSTEDLPQLEATFTVIDASGKPIFGLSHGEVKVLVDGRRQYNYTVTPIRPEGEGISLIILMQTISTMRGEIFYHSKRIVTNLLNRLAPEDTVALVTYDDKITVLNQLTDEKFRLHRELQKIQLYDGLLSLDMALSKLAETFTESALTDSIILLLYHQTTSIDSGTIETMKDLISDKNIKLLVVPVKSPQQPAYINHFVSKIGGTLITYEDKNDLWSLSKFLNPDSSGLYKLTLQSGHTVDYEPHTMTIAVEFFGFSASREVSYIGSSGFGINPQYRWDTYLSSSPWFVFFFVMVGCFCGVLCLAIGEKFNRGRRFHWFAYVIVSLAGGLIGFILSRLTQHIP